MLSALLDGKKAIKEGLESQLLPCLPEAVNDTTERSKIMSIIIIMVTMMMMIMKMMIII